MNVVLNKQNTTAFGAVVSGDTFIWDNRVYMKLREYKEQITAKVQEHITWLEPQDHLKRATSGYQGLLNFMQGDKSYLLKEFFRINDIHDNYRQERFEDVFPELKDLRSYVT